MSSRSRLVTHIHTTTTARSYPSLPTMDAIPLLRGDSADSIDSPFGSPLNTPADERTLHFDSLTEALLTSAGRLPKVLEQSALEPPAYGELGRGRSPRRVSFPRQFSKALEEANKSTESSGIFAVLARAPSIERGYSEDSSMQTPEPSPVMSPEMLSESTMEPLRVQTPEPRILDVYETGTPSIVRTTPRGRPLLRRDIFSPTPNPVPFFVERDFVDSVPELTPRAHSTLRNRKGIYLLPNETIVTVPDMPTIVDAPQVLQNDNADADADHDESENVDLEMPSFPQISPLFPLQLVFFPLWCVIVGAMILLHPSALTAVAFPASAPRASADTRPSRAIALAQSHLARCLPFTAPPSRIRAFAHWATFAHLHVAIFIGALVGVAYASQPAGALLAAACAVRFADVWGGFSVDEQAELGADVRQTLYRVLFASGGSGCGLADRDKLRREGDRFFIVRAPRGETREEVLAAGGAEYSSSEEEDE
ncbi:hypothetical protein GGX14DRAFT_693015 [Mycena pura]|uniref:Uncharacterized protein n=1 Tax=Mycena pura TaxID=153505 RepID=A0AAD6UNM8_9AGAR|nr:hypothetical protein GGX14DRAFT_702137 [Mycena pura]KAJ7226842.1 hypothetical protein GGX14DRAFT_693015 [Mycena pura]